tara:strand:- start:464 stop:580 length:117 start_codon:yes stop_codon:yes gene_type:complete
MVVIELFILGFACISLVVVATADLEKPEKTYTEEEQTE